MKTPDIIKIFMLDKKIRPKIVWHQLAGLKLKATWNPVSSPGARGYEQFGLREADMDPIAAWCRETHCGQRIGFDLFLFNRAEEITMFLLKWEQV